jgi:hypothetical protein|tara:strand:+ start:159 stop:323 length:165 start_codon:yes stop_codon:yes gene_type:complete
MEWLQTMGWFMNKEGPVRYARYGYEATQRLKGYVFKSSRTGHLEEPAAENLYAV